MGTFSETPMVRVGSASAGPVPMDAVIAERGERREALHLHGAVREPRILFAVLLRAQVGALGEGLLARGFQRDGIDGRVLQLIGEIELRIEAHVHGAQQLQVRGAARGLRHQQMLAVVGELHVGARDFDARARAGLLLIARLGEQGLGERDVGLRGFDIGVGLDGGEIGASGTCAATSSAALSESERAAVTPTFDACKRRMAPKSKTLCVAVARASKVVNGPTKVGKWKPGNRRDNPDAQGRQIFGAALDGDRPFHIRQQRGAGFEGSHLRLLQTFRGELNVGVALR